MEGSVSAPPQRVCPKCARISWATGPRCPYCRARFRRQNIAVIAWMLAVAVLVTLAGMAAILLLVGNHVTDHVNDRADQIERQFNAIQHEIDQRLPAGGVPSVTPVPTPSPSPSPTATPTETPSPSPSASPSATPTATNTPSSDSGSTSDQNRTETRP
ncbi:hypothetical protein [Candidatus Solirubrobacter pratensis]|uniref:hypothetical protein n=1 Tax=Candidatus Solirubrobacter pratensis TaxID=1298857 RepID=UPI000406BD36|nr:hypothetical protein [Candidatus Solirubrobacter pratensis]